MAALVVPLVYSRATLDPVLLPSFLVVSLVGVVLVTAFGVRVVRSRTSLSVSPAEALVLGCLVAFIVVAAISVLISGPQPDGIFELLRLATLVWLIHATARAVDGEASGLALLSKLVTVAVLLAGGFAVLQFYQVAIFEWMKRDTSVDSTLGHRNLLASFMTLAFPFVAYALLTTRGPWRLASAATTSIAAFLLVALQSRAAWVAFPGGLAFVLLALAIVARRARPTRDRLAAYGPRLAHLAAAVALGASLALLFYAPGARAPMRERAGSIVQMGDASIHERLELWSRTLRMIRDHPMAGVGLGNWRIVVPTYGAEGSRSDTGTLHFQRPHDDFLWVASETGVLGGVLYLSLFACALGIGVRTMARATTAHDRLAAALLTWGPACYAIDSLFSFPKERVSHAVYLALLVGTLLSFARKVGSGARPFPRRWAITITAIVWAGTLVAGRFAVGRLRAEVHLRRALEARAVQDWPAMIAQLDRIDRRFYTMDPSSAPVTWYRGVARFESGDRAAACADFRDALRIHPNHVHVLNNIATCQTLEGDRDAAVRTYGRAIELAPRFEEARVNLGSLLHGMGRDEEAFQVLEPAAAYAVSPRFETCFSQVKAALEREK